MPLNDNFLPAVVLCVSSLPANPTGKGVPVIPCLFSASYNEPLFQLGPLDAATIQIIRILIIKCRLQWARLLSSIGLSC